MMNQLIARFPDQLRESLEIGEAAVINKHTEEIHNIYVAGLGGSGIGGDFVNGFVKDEISGGISGRISVTFFHNPIMS